MEKENTPLNRAASVFSLFPVNHSRFPVWRNADEALYRFIIIILLHIYFYYFFIAFIVFYKIKGANLRLSCKTEVRPSNRLQQEKAKQTPPPI
jgi:hypothetical protein